MKEYRRICANISLKALEHNLDAIHDCIDRDTKIIAVVKADGYGHGAVPLAEVMEQREDVWGYAVATPEEAEELYSNGIKKPILILGYTFPEYDEQIVKEGLRPAVFSLERAKQLSEEAVRQNKECKIHIKLDTGMSRIGFQVTEQSADEIAQIAASPNIIIEGIFTHFATADGDDVAFEKQRSLFYEMIGNCKFKYIHCCNSAAMTYHHDEKSNMGRLGITMYGCSPNGEEETKFKQVMSLYTKVAMIKKIPAGDQVGYGLTYTAKEDEYIATLPIGYADGFIRKNQGRKVYINGKYYEIVGRVCMDQMMVRVDENVKIGDRVEIFGEHISLESMAKDLDTISYEVLCLISKRVPRVYVQDGQVKELL